MNITELENKFHSALKETNEISKRYCHHNPTRIIIMMAEYGAVDTAKRLMENNASTSGYLVAAECGRLDITIEATMLRPEFAPLFTKEELQVAKSRLPEEIVKSIVNKA